MRGVCSKDFNVDVLLPSYLTTSQDRLPPQPFKIRQKQHVDIKRLLLYIRERDMFRRMLYIAASGEDIKYKSNNTKNAYVGGRSITSCSAADLVQREASNWTCPPA
jgi:hypothetical protein